MDEIIAKSREYWRNAGRLRMGHYIAAESAERKHKWIGIPSVIFSAVVATSVFSTLSDQVDMWIRIVTGCVAVCAAVLASLQAFLNFADKAEHHKIAAAKYFTARRQLDMFQLTYQNKGDDAATAAIEELKIITEQLATLSNESPTLSEAVYRQATRAFEEAHPETRSETSAD